MVDTALPPYRVCDLCGGVDRDPRHVVAGVIEGVHTVNPVLRIVVIENLEALMGAGKIDLDAATRVMADYADTTSQDRHLDCCAAAGCPSGTCAGQIDGAEGKTGAALRKHILARAEA